MEFNKSSYRAYIPLNILFIALFHPYLALSQTDTSAYNVQRNKINQLLEERSSKFGQYDQSLTKRSGIFGLKTKRDMQSSNDILTQIVLTDNDIFSELKILLDYKDFEKKEVENRAETTEGRIDRFQGTITRLQQENDRLKTEIEKQENQIRRLWIYVLIAVIVALLLTFYTRKKLRNTDNTSL